MRTQTSKEEAKRILLLEAALATFLRYGYRKTTMEEVADAAQVSRQSLYLHFESKEELYKAVVQYGLDASLELTRFALGSSQPLEERLVAAFDAWKGRHMRTAGDSENFNELRETARRLLGSLVADREKAFLRMITEAMEACGMSAASASAAITARDLAQTLFVAGYGVADTSQTRAEYADGIRKVARVVCAHLKNQKARRRRA